MTRTFLISSLAILASAGSILAQNPLEFSEPGPADQRCLYEMRVRMEVQQTLDAWKWDWEEGDVDGVVGRYAEGAVVFPAKGGRLEGERDLRAYFAARDVEDVASPTVAFATSGDFAYVVELLTYRAPPDAQTPTEETTLILLRRWGGVWRIVSQLSRPDPGRRIPRVSASNEGH